MSGSSTCRSPGRARSTPSPTPATGACSTRRPTASFRIAQRVAAQGLQFDAHAVGDAAIETMLDVYERVDRERSIRGLRWALSHADFMRPDLTARAARLGVVVDIQPVRLYLDVRTLVRQFDAERMGTFQPLHSMLAAGVMTGEAPTTC